MSDATALKLGQKVPDFELNSLRPRQRRLREVLSLRRQIAHKRWTILFFYPADFTFV